MRQVVFRLDATLFITLIIVYDINFLIKLIPWRFFSLLNFSLTMVLFFIISIYISKRMNFSHFRKCTRNIKKIEMFMFYKLDVLNMFYNSIGVQYRFKAF